MGKKQDYKKLIDSYNPDVKTIVKIFLKASKKRIFLSCVFGVLTFLLITSLFMVWFAYQSNSFHQFLSQNDWYDDGNHSSYTIFDKSISSDIENDYLDNAITNIEDVFNAIIPNVVSKSTGTIEVIIRGIEPVYGQFTNYTIKTLNSNSNISLSQSLVAGRLPRNSSEILLFRQNELFNYYNVNDTVQLKPDLVGVSLQNFTITGIVENFGESLLMNGYSKDLIWKSYENERYCYSTFSESFCTFLTLPNYFYELINNFSSFSATFALAVDIIYDTTTIDYRNLKFYINTLEQKFQGVSLDFDPDINIKIGADLIDNFSSFRYHWLLESTRISSIIVIVFFLLIMIIYEIFNFEAHDLETIFRLMKLQGLDDKPIQLVILAENIIVTVISLVCGLILGTIIGYLGKLFLNLNVSFIYYIKGLKNPFLLITLIVFSFGVFITGYFIRYSSTKKTNILVKEDYESKHKKRVLGKLSVKIEQLLFLSGLLLLAGGIPGYIFTSGLIMLDISTTIELLYVLSLIIALLGIILITFSLFILISKLVTITWSFIGKKIWIKKKLFFTLSLKNLTIHPSTYQRTLLAILMIGITIIPGFILNTSINKHLDQNATLASGCTDILIDNWNMNATLRQNINQIKGVVQTTEIILTEVFSITYERSFKITILIINSTEFIQTIDFSKLGSKQYTDYDIESLSTNLTYLMDLKFAKKHNYDKGQIFMANDFWDSLHNYNLSYINSFNIFPALPKIQNKPFYQQIEQVEKFQLVMSFQTYEILMKDTNNLYVNSLQHQLLVKTDHSMNISDITTILRENYSINPQTYEDIKKEMENLITPFGLILLRYISIIIIFVGFFFGFVASQNIFLERIRNIETDYRIGATLQQLWLEFTLELVVLSILPIIISIVFGKLSLLLYPIILNIDESYLSFKPWIPWWFIFLLFFIIFLIILFGWLVGLIPKMNNYKPIKQE